MTFESKVKVKILIFWLVKLVKQISFKRFDVVVHILHTDCLRCEDVNNHLDLLISPLIKSSRSKYFKYVNMTCYANILDVSI